MQDKVSNFLHTLKYLKKKQLFIFGAGEMGIEISDELRMFSDDVVGFLDNDKAKWGSHFNGMEVFPAKHLLSYEKDEIFIFVAVRARDDISELLIDMGFVHGKHFAAESFFKRNLEVTRDSVCFEDEQGALSENNTATVLTDIYKSASEKSSEYVAYDPNGITLTEEDIKLIAFYLPQFHPFKENDEWWGKGFTEWTNVTKVAPQFVGHYQPHLPDELGFYDLRLKSIQERQVELAKHYGIYGFCFHYYNFAGKRLLETPLNMFAENEDIDFPFCICWANEPWTKTWDGSENLILMNQEHSLENDTAAIHDMMSLFKNKNYIKVDNKPVLIVYRVSLLPELQKTIENWKSILQAEGFSGIYLVASQARGFTGHAEINFDAEVEFPPHRMLGTEKVTYEQSIVNPNFEGTIIDYKKFIDNKGYLEETPENVLKTAFPNWDNTARRPNNGLIFHGSTPELFQIWLEDIMRFTAERKQNKQDNFVFINAWNEWAEGAHLEPDRKYGYAYLQATKSALTACRKER